MNRVVVTGIGFISPIGNSEEELFNNIKNGYCAVDFIKNIDTSDINVKIACECKDFNPLDYFSKKEIKRLDRVNQFAIVAARKALEDSMINFSDFEEDRISVIVSSGIGGLSTLERESFVSFERGFNKISPFFIPMVIANMSASHIAIDLSIHGYVGCPVTACAGSANAILDGYRGIKDGYYDIALVGGTEASINKLGLSGFSSMRALNETTNINRASIPFDKERNGFVMGEGSAILVLEKLESAKKRNAKIYGEIIGAGISCDAGHITAPNEDGTYVKMAMEYAIKEANIKKEEIDYINAHGTSTPLNDKTECIAIKKTFGEYSNKIKMSSTKSNTGHLLGASGSLEMIISLLAIKNSYIPPTINYEVYDEDCNTLIVKNKGIEEDINIIMSNSLGFGGHNVSLIARRYSDGI